MGHISKCKNCSQYLIFENNSPPINSSDKQPHKCSKTTTTCKFCTVQIYFDDDIRSSSGKLIPLSVKTGSKHRCRNRPFNKQTRRAWWRERQRAAEEAHRRARESTSRIFSQDKFLKACRILGVLPESSDDQIKTAYRKLMLQYHPDRYDGDDAHDKAVEINWAYENCVKPSN